MYVMLLDLGHDNTVPFQGLLRFQIPALVWYIVPVPAPLSILTPDETDEHVLQIHTQFDADWT